MTKKSVILATTHMALQDRTSGDLDLVWLEAVREGYRGNSGCREK